MAVTRRYCVEDAIIDYTKAELLYEDVVRNKIFEKVFEKFPLNNQLDKILTLKKIGKNTNCEVEQIFYLSSLAEYFEIIKRETTCGSEKEFDTLKEEYKLDCIQNTLTCNYGLGNLIDELVELLALRTPYNGIGYMTISLDTCELFKVYGR